MTSYFEDFKKSMKQRSRILVSLVEKHYNNVCFLVDTNYTYVQESIPKVRWLIHLSYEVNVDEASTTIIEFLVEEMDKDSISFINYGEVKSRITINLKKSTVIRKKKKMV